MTPIGPCDHTTGQESGRLGPSRCRRALGLSGGVRFSPARPQDLKTIRHPDRLVAGDTVSLDPAVERCEPYS